VAACRYCQAHTSASAHRAGAALKRIEAAFADEKSPLLSQAERAALRIANDASVVPNAVTKGHFERLRQHFDEGQIVELVAVIALFGFLNRWNDTMATALEEEPLAFARQALAPHGWHAGKHASGA
jgi:alkylhydroperoxidase family enzyme